MCEKLEPKNIKIINLLKSKIENSKNENPTLIIEKVNWKNKTFNLIQDGHLIAGTKQRVSVKFIKNVLKSNKKITTLVYSGTSHGFGPVATAYAAYKLNLNSLIFLSDANVDKIDKNEKNDTRQINTLHALNAEVYLCDDYYQAKKLKYKMTDIEKNVTKEEYYLVPMGLNDKEGRMIKILSEQIKKASKNTILDTIKKKRFWLVAGTGGILMALNKAFPNSEFFIFLTGSGRHRQNIIDLYKVYKNIHLLKPENFDLSDSFSTVKNYDEFIWHYVKKYAKEGDFIWSVSSDDYLFMNLI